MAALSTQAVDAKNALDSLPAEEQKMVVQQVLEANPAWIPTSDAAKLKLWQIMLILVGIIGVIAVVGGILLTYGEQDATASWVLATAAVTGLIGLFAKSPAN